MIAGLVQLHSPWVIDECGSHHNSVIGNDMLIYEAVNLNNWLINLLGNADYLVNCTDCHNALFSWVEWWRSRVKFSPGPFPTCNLRLPAAVLIVISSIPTFIIFVITYWGPTDDFERPIWSLCKFSFHLLPTDTCTLSPLSMTGNFNLKIKHLFYNNLNLRKSKNCVYSTH